MISKLWAIAFQPHNDLLTIFHGETNYIIGFDFIGQDVIGFEALRFVPKSSLVLQGYARAGEEGDKKQACQQKC